MKKFEVRLTCEFIRTLAGYVTVYAENEADAKSAIGIVPTPEWLDQHFIGEGDYGAVKVVEVTEIPKEKAND
jgi:hypothetical protein